MSAMAGIVCLDGAPVVPEDVERMSRALNSNGGEIRRKEVHGSCALIYAGHHFTPEDKFERQPLFMRDGSRFMFCGRLDNRDELIAALYDKQSEARNLADSAIAARAWERWGREGLDRWVGPHASAFWRPEDRELLLARGAPIGRSLMLCRRGETIYFSTTLNALFALPQVPREFDEAVLADILMGAPRGSGFMYRGLEAIPTSHWVRFRTGRTESRRYWAPDPARRLKFNSEPECWEAFSELFRRVVKQHLRSPGPIGIRLSGGLDSSTVAAQAALLLSQQGESLSGYTRVPLPGIDLAGSSKNHYNDESDKVLALARMYPNLRANLIDPGEGGVLDGLEDWFATNNTPWIVPPTFLSGYRPMLEKAQQDGIKLLLNAGMGNLTFSYNGHGRLHELFVRGRWLQLSRELRAFSWRGQRVRRVFSDNVLNPLIPMVVHRWSARRRARHADQWEWFSSINADFAAETGAADRLVENENLRLYWSKWSSWKKRASTFLNTHQNAQGGGGEVLYGFDQRDPTGDRRIIEFCLALPEKYYLKDGVNRRLARLGTGRLLPKEISEEYRRGRQDVDWRHRTRRDLVELKENVARFRNDPDVSRYLDVPRIEKLLKEFEQSAGGCGSQREVARFQLAMLGPLHAGNFIRWFHGRND